MIRSRRTRTDHDDDTLRRIEDVRRHVTLLKLDPTARERVFIESSFVTEFYSDYLSNVRGRLHVEVPVPDGNSLSTEFIGELRGKGFFELLDVPFGAANWTRALKTLTDLDPRLDWRSVLLWAFLGLPAGFRSIVPTPFSKGHLRGRETLERVRYVELTVLSKVKAESIVSQFEARIDRTASAANQNEPEARGTDTADMTASLRADPVTHLVLTVRAPWPRTSRVSRFASDTIRRYGDQLAENVVPRDEFDKLIRLCATEALVGFAGLDARRAMGAWDSWSISPSWGKVEGMETQSQETAFSRASSGLKPRKAPYLSLLRSIKP